MRNWSVPGEHRELVQIGAIRVDTETLYEIDSFDIFVKPSINPILSDFFVTLTGITQEKINTEGVDFTVAWKNFTEWRDGAPAYSFGNDEEVIKENCTLCNMSYNQEGQFHDICVVFENNGISTKQYHSSTIVRAFGKEPVRPVHNALNDARCILDGLVLLQQYHGLAKI